MFEYLAFIIALLLALGYIFLIYKPRKRLLWYKSVFEALGYKVKFYPFEAFKLGSLVEAAIWKQKYGDVHYLLRQEEASQWDVILHNMIHKVQVIILNPELTKSWLAPENLNKFQKEPSLVQNLVRLSGGPGLLFSQGDAWKKKRKITTKAFNHELLVANIPNIYEIINQVFDEYEQDFQKNHPERKNQLDANIGDIYTQIFSKVLLQIFFGNKAQKKRVNGEDLSLFFMNLVGDANRLTQKSPLGVVLGTWFNNLGLTSIDRSVNKRIKMMRVIAKEMIQQRIQLIKQNGFNKNSISILEALLKEYVQQNNGIQFLDKIDPNLLIQDFNIFFAAGTDTTTCMTKNMIYFLGQNPEIFNKMRQQINKHLPNEGDQLNWDNLKKVQYLDWVQNELIRICGPVNLVFLRAAKEDTFISKLPIKKGDLVMYDSTASHYNPKIYKNPKQFRPQRWESQCNKVHPFAFLGFSSGPRSCIGKTLALLQNKLAIIRFTRRYKSINLHGNKLKIDYRLAFEVIDFPITLQKNVV